MGCVKENKQARILMTHEEHISRLIVQSMVGTIDAAGQRELEAWLSASPSHRQLYDELTRAHLLKDYARQLDAVDYRPALKSMRLRIEEAERGGVQAGRAEDHRGRMLPLLLRRARWWVAGAAAVVALLAGTYYYMQLTDVGRPVASVVRPATPAITHGTTMATLRLGDGRVVRLGSDARANRRAILRVCGNDYHGNIVITTPRGGEYRLTLTDGTEVALNADSRLEYPAVFDGKERRVKAEGEAFFKVAHDKEHPFFVETGGQELRVVGTEFNVNSYTRGTVVTTLLHGLVTIRPRGSRGGVLTLHPGEQAEYSDKTGAAQIRQANTEVVGSWTTGSFVFENQTLEQIMQELSRWYNFDYTFRDASKRGTVFMGSVPRYGNFKDVLRILELSGGLHFQVKGRKVYIQ